MLADLSLLLERPADTIKKMYAGGRFFEPAYVSAGGHRIWLYGDLVRWARAGGHYLKPIEVLGWAA